MDVLVSLGNHLSSNQEHLTLLSSPSSTAHFQCCHRLFWKNH